MGRVWVSNPFQPTEVCRIGSEVWPLRLDLRQVHGGGEHDTRGSWWVLFGVGVVHGG